MAARVAWFQGKYGFQQRRLINSITNDASGVAITQEEKSQWSGKINAWKTT